MLFRRSAPALLIPVLAILAIVFAGTNQAASPNPRLQDRGLAPRATAPEFVPDRLVVRFRAGVSAAQAQALHASLGGRLTRLQPRSRLHVLAYPPGVDLDRVIDAYERSPLVLEAGRSRVTRLLEGPNDTNYAYQWSMHDTAGGVRVEPAWAAAPNAGAGVVVAVIDSGVAYETYTRPAAGGLPEMSFRPAPDLAGVTIVSPWNFVHDDEHANDDHSHGSHVAGTITQATNNAYGVVGIAHESSLMPVKSIDYTGNGHDNDTVEAIYYAVDHGADVISMSLGYPGTGTPNSEGVVCSEVVGLNAALDYAQAHGVVVVAAAGNDSSTTVLCPAAYPTVIAVGATRYDGQVAFYSNHGSALDVTAPGGDPNVDQNGDGFSDGVLQETYCNPGSYIILIGLFTGTANFNSFCDVFMSGTSMATPHVSGIAALLLGEDPNLTPAQVRQIIETTARDRGAAGWDDAYGWGLVDAAAAAAAVDPATPTPMPTATSTNTPTATPTNTATPTPTSTPAPTDVVTITKLSYSAGKKELAVEATSSFAPNAQLSLQKPVGAECLGSYPLAMSYNSAKKKYSAKVVCASRPSSVTVTSSAGGSATRSP
jgi:serine protease